MRIAISVLSAVAAVWLLLGFQGIRTPGKSSMPMEGPRAWGMAWEVLSPRHQGTSAVPLIAFATPGWDGPVEVTVETQGRRSVTVTSARSLGWPESLDPLRVGEWCGVAVLGPRGGAAEAAYLRVPPPEKGASDTMSRAWGR